MSTKCTHDDPLVLAHGENGLELTRKSETVEIEAVPLGAGNIVTPATIAWLSSIRDGGGIPTRLREITLPDGEGRRFVSVSFDCTPFERYQLDSGPVFGDWSSCALRHEADANHPVFGRLTDEERERMRLAVRECEASSGTRH